MKKLSLLLLIAASLGACKKDSESTPVLSRTDLLTGKDWILTAATVNPGISIVPGVPAITDVYAFMDACSKDNYVRFEKPNVYTENEGASVCQGSAQTSTGTWMLSTDGNTLTINDSSGSETVTVSELTATSMKEVYKDPGGVYTYTFTFAKK